MKSSLLLLSVAAGLGAACSRGAAGGPPPAPSAVPVSAAHAVARDVPIELRAVGNVEAVANVVLKPQLSGQISEVHFTEGAEVKAGDLLLVIDRRPYQAALNRAQANLDRTDVMAEDAERMSKQMEGAHASQAASLRDFEDARAKARALVAEQAAGRTEVENARLALEYAEIRAPIPGRIGFLNTKAGNVVKANETELATIEQVEPIQVAFAVPEQYLSKIARLQAEKPLGVRVAIPGDDREPIAGALSFIDNKVDTETGTIKLRARFGNADRRLWPGQFVEVVLDLGTETGAVVVPASAVQAGQQGSFVYVVGADRKVEQRAIVLSRLQDREAVVTQGLAAGEEVVTDGHLRLVPGVTVEVKAAAVVRT